MSTVDGGEGDSSISAWSDRLAMGLMVVVMLAGLSVVLCVLFAPLFLFPFPASLVGIPAVPAIFLLLRLLTGQNTIETLVVLGVIGILTVLLVPAAREARQKERQEERAREEQTEFGGMTLSMYGRPS